MKTKIIRRVSYNIAASANRYPTETAAHSAIIGHIESFWIRKDITLIPLEPGITWSIKLGEKIHQTARVIRQGRNYHFAFPA